MKILIQIKANTLLQCHEALSLAFALAAFEHDIQLQLGDYFIHSLIQAPHDKLAKMLSSLDLYDLPPTWVSQVQYQSLQSIFDAQSNQPAWWQQLMILDEPVSTVIDEFDTVFIL